MPKRKQAPRKLYEQVQSLRTDIIRTMLGHSHFAKPADVYRLVELARKLERSRWEAPDAAE